MQKKIVVVGSINLDLVARVRRAPAMGETVTGEGFNSFPGGKGANQAVAAARLGGEVVLIGRLGDDMFAAQLRSSLEEAGVDTQLVEGVQGASGTALIVTAEDGGNSIVVIPGANHRLTSADLDRCADTICTASLVLAQLEVPLATVERLAAMTLAAGVPFMLDPAPAVPLPASLLSAVTWLTPNESEALLLTQADEREVTPANAAQVARTLLDLGARNVLLKMGAKGVYMEGADVEACQIAAPQVDAVDTTAAGDAFNGAFAYALVTEGMGARAAVEFAMAAAALSVTRHGAQVSMPGLAEVRAFLAGRNKAAV